MFSHEWLSRHGSLELLPPSHDAMDYASKLLPSIYIFGLELSLSLVGEESIT